VSAIVYDHNKPAITENPVIAKSSLSNYPVLVAAIILE